MNKERQTGGRARPMLWTGILLCVLIAGIVAVAVVTNTGDASPAGMLEGYYRAMYTADGGGMEDVVSYLAPKIRQETLDELTVGGTTGSQLALWRTDAAMLVGDNIRVKVKLLETREGTAAQLQTIRETYAGAESFLLCSFRLTLSGSEGEQSFVGVAPLLQLDGKWYLTAKSITLSRMEEAAG